MEACGTIIMVAPNGARKSKQDHPNLPITPDEVGSEAVRCLEAGATILHLHARDRDGGHTLDPEIYRQFIRAAEQAVGDDMLIQITTEAVGRYSADEQIASVLELRPKAVSLAVRELIPDQDSEVGAAKFLQEIAGWGCSPQFILYDTADAFRFAELVGHGVIPQKEPSVIFVLGRYLRAGEQSDPRKLIGFLHDWPGSWPWTVCAFGEAETKSLVTAAAMGGHVRVGFENNCLDPDGSVADSNACRVGLIKDLLVRAGCAPANLGQTRKILERASQT